MLYSRLINTDNPTMSMRILAAISEAEEVRKILRHLVTIGRSPSGFDRLR
jgi:hypothetical protein